MHGYNLREENRLIVLFQENGEWLFFMWFVSGISLAKFSGTDLTYVRIKSENLFLREKLFRAAMIQLRNTKWKLCGYFNMINLLPIH